MSLMINSAHVSVQIGQVCLRIPTTNPVQINTYGARLGQPQRAIYKQFIHSVLYS